MRAEIKQKKPFRLREEGAFVNLLRTADVLLQGVAETLKALGLSPTQYNVLRILGKLEAPIADLYARQLGHLGAARLRTVIELLEQARSRAE